ncbi:uncharacterized protein [Nicotiana tomentosiformis]|uniref:uncharacterized protein n=1 Tax=Nicotiana tomentosiformis TaxID=4098 RepID=UPI00388C7987
MDDVIIKSRMQEDHVRDLRKLLTDECQEAFDKIKEYLSNPSVLVPQEPGRPLFLYLTVLENSFVCVLGKHDVTGKREQAIYYLSKKFTSYEAMMDPLKYIFHNPMPTGRLAKWQILLNEFDIVYVTLTTMKAQALTDHLAKNPIDVEYQPLSTYFPEEEVNSVEVIPENVNAWKMFFDGAVNTKGIGIGAILILRTCQHYPTIARLWLIFMNNTTEYEACIMGMNMAVDMDVQELLIIGDSNLIIRQTQGEWETRDIKLIPYRQHVEDLSKQFKSIEFKYIPRFHNELVDTLATLASMLPYPSNIHIDPLEIQVQERHGYCNAVELDPDGEPWYHDIKRTPDLNLLRCVDSREAEGIMNEVHLGVRGPHMNMYVLAMKILRTGYYWMTMEKDCFSFVRKFHQCQIHSDLIYAPSSELHPMSAPWPFIAWGMDVIGPIELKASNGHRFILVSIDYFTKWVEAVTFNAVTKKAVVYFVHSNIIYHFGIPKTIITNNTPNLNNHLMREL